MVKRHMRTARRPVLQLNDNPSTQQSSSNPSSAGRYACVVQYSDSDSDNELGSSSKQPQETLQPETSGDTIDEQVQDFLREINTLKNTQDENLESVHRDYVSDIVNTAKSLENGEPSSQMPMQSSSASWQQCYDESTGYVYYWNTQTNEVTWECPPEYSDYASSFHAVDQTINNELSPPINQPNATGKNKKTSKKKKSKDDDIEEGKIIPITSFGPESSESSSSDEDSSDHVVSSRKPHKKKIQKQLASTSQNARKQNSASVEIGPQLPSDAVERVNHIGPQLPPDPPGEIGPQLPLPLSLVRNGYTNSALPLQRDGSESEHKTKVDVKLGIPARVEDANCDQGTSPRQPTSVDKDLRPPGVDSDDSQMAKDDNAVLPPAVDLVKSAPHFSDSSRSISDNSKANEPKLEASTVPDLVKQGPSSDTSSNNGEGVNTVSAETGALPKEVNNHKEPGDLKIPSYYLPRNTGSEGHRKGASSTSRSKEQQPFWAADGSSTYQSDYMSRSAEVPSCSSSQGAASTSSSTVAASSSSKGEGGEGEVCSSSSEPDSTTKKEVNGQVAKDGGPNVSQSLLTLQGYESEEDGEEHMRQGEKRNLPEFDNRYSSGRSGFGFSKRRKMSLDIASCSRFDRPSTSKAPSSYPYVSFIKSKEVLYLPQLNDREPACSGSKKPSANDDGDIDIDDIEKALDLALERNKGQGNVNSEGLVNEGTVSQGNRKTEKDNIASSSGSNSVNTTVTTHGTFTEWIRDISSELIDKLKFLTSNWTNASVLSWLLVQVQTRLKDWQEGALQADYFYSRLKEARDYLSQFEQSVIQNGWKCQWDRDQKHYFYVNTKTGRSQWNFPAMMSEVQASCSSSMLANDSHTASTTESDKPDSTLSQNGFNAQNPCVSSSSSSSSSVTVQPSVVKKVDKTPDSVLGTSECPSSPSPSLPPLPPQPLPPPPLPPGSPPPLPLHPPPPVPPPPSSPPPLPPDSTEENEIMEVEMAIQDDGDEKSKDLHSTCDSAMTLAPQQISVVSESSILSAVSSSVVDTSEPSFIIARPPQPAFSVTGVVMQQNVFAPEPAPVVSAATASVSVREKEWPQTFHAPAEEHSNSSRLVQPSTSKAADGNSNGRTSQPANGASDSHSSSTSKKRKKPKLVTGLTLKKKDMPSLVEKWQRIKEEQRDRRKDLDDGVSTTM